MPEFEIRTFEGRIEAVDDRRIEGLAIVFDSLSLDLGGFQERIDPAAVDRTLREATDVRALVDHDAAKILGRTRAGTLTLRKESRGLRAIIEPDAGISYAADLLRSIRRGDVSGMSFAFRVAEEGVSWDWEQSPPVRTITDLHMREVSVVTFPAYPDTTVALRSLDAERTARKARIVAN